MAALDERRRPIAEQPVDLDDPTWLENLEALPTPLEQAGIQPDGDVGASVYRLLLRAC
jgi:hypothetical protein